MCMLTFLPAGSRVDTEALLNGGIRNPDGHGWAVVAKDRIVVGHAMRIEEAIDAFYDVRHEFLDGPAMFHSRWATHGSVNLENCHPFKVGGSEQTYLGHNGVLPCNPRKGDDRSDTRLFADEILPRRFKRLDKASAFNAMEKYIGRGNKLCILTVDRRYKKNAYLVNERAGNWHSGIWYSNFDYERRFVSKYASCGTSIGWSPETSNWQPTMLTQAKFTMPEDELCYICEYGVIDSANYCVDCGACQDCLEDARNCLCFSRFDWKNEEIGSKK